LPLDPLKLSAVVERLMLLANTGLAINIAQRGRRTFFFTTTAPQIGGLVWPKWCSKRTYTAHLKKVGNILPTITRNSRQKMTPRSFMEIQKYALGKGRDLHAIAKEITQ
jgi:hypothetical protein